MYIDEEGLIKPVEDLNKVCHLTPVHLIFGEVSNFMSDFMFISFALSSVAY